MGVTSCHSGRDETLQAQCCTPAKESNSGFTSCLFCSYRMCRVRRSSLLLHRRFTLSDLFAFAFSSLFQCLPYCVLLFSPASSFVPLSRPFSFPPTPFPSSVHASFVFLPRKCLKVPVMDTLPFSGPARDCYVKFCLL